MTSQKIYKKLWIVSAVGIAMAFFALTLPFPVFSQGAEPSYTPLAPIGEAPADIAGGGASYLTGLFSLSVKVAGVLAVLMIVIGGIRYMLSDAFTSKEDAKKQIWAALWGLLILFASVTILETINPNLLNLKLQLPSLGGTTGGGTGTSGGLPTTNQATGTTFDETDQARLNAILADEERVRAELADPNAPFISVNKAACTELGQTNCTNVGGLPSATIVALRDLKQDCACDVGITGGTEFWLHETHGAGRNIVDLGKNGTLDNFINENTNTTGRTSTGDTIHYMGSGDRYVDEGDHWHIILGS